MFRLCIMNVNKCLHAETFAQKIQNVAGNNAGMSIPHISLLPETISFYHKLERSDFYSTAYHQRFTVKGPRDSSRGRKEPAEILRWVSLPDCASGTARMIWVNPQARSMTSYLSRESL